MPEANFFLLFIKPLNRARLPYMVTGSMASILYGEPRLTHDIDIVIQLKRSDATKIEHLFPLDDFYCPPEEALIIEAARSSRGHFNIIHHKTGLKADFYIQGQDPLHHWAMSRVTILDVDGISVTVAPATYVIVRKLQYFREGGSQKHLSDICGILETSGEDLDMTQIEAKVSELQLEHEWETAKNFDR